MIPKTNPVKFWNAGEVSFNNQQLPSSLLQSCFHHPWKSTSTIRVMVIDEVGSTIYLDVYNESDELQESVLFTDAGANGAYIAGVTLTAYEGQKIYFQIRKEVEIFDSAFDADLDGWVNNGSALLIDWAWSASNGGCARLNYTLPDTGKDLRKAIVIPASTDESDLLYCKLNLDVQLSAGLSLILSTKDVTDAQIATQTVSADGEITFTAEEIQDATSLDISEGGSLALATPYTWAVLSASMVAHYSLGVTDLIHVVLSTEPEHDEIVSFEFGDRQTYGEIQYDPITTFNIDIPGRFYKERSPNEIESEAFGESVVTMLSNTVKDQKLFESDPLPQYLCKILMRVLNHNTLHNGGKYWVREEAIEEVDIGPHSPYKKINVWLTDRSSYDTNVYSQLITI